MDGCIVSSLFSPSLFLFSSKNLLFHCIAQYACMMPVEEVVMTALLFSWDVCGGGGIVHRALRVPTHRRQHRCSPSLIRNPHAGKNVRALDIEVLSLCK